jgi:hypothetical protein
VTFKDGTASLGTATLDGGGVASLTVNTLSVGSHSITAAYGGDTNYTGSTSTVLTETVQDFQLVTSGSGASTAVTSATVQAGGTAVYQFQVSPTNGSTFPYAISFSLSGPPVGSTYTITPNPIPTGSGAQTVVVLVQTPLSAGLRRSLGGGMVFAVALLPILNMVRLRRKCRVWCTVLFLLLVILAVLGLWGCGGGGSSSQAPRVYGMQFNAASGNLVHSTTLTLTVQ